MPYQDNSLKEVVRIEPSPEVKKFLDNVKEIVKQLSPKSKEGEFKFTYREKVKEELKRIIRDSIKSGKTRVEGRRSIHYREGDGFNAGEIETTAVILICTETPYGTMTFSLEPLEKIVLKAEDLTGDDIEELVEKLDIDSKLEYGFAPKHPFRQKYKKLREQEWEEYEKFKEQEKLKLKQWEQENREKLEKIMELYNNLSEEAKKELRYLIDPYNGLFGFDPTIEHLIELVKQL